MAILICDLFLAHQTCQTLCSTPGHALKLCIRTGAPRVILKIDFISGTFVWVGLEEVLEVLDCPFESFRDMCLMAVSGHKEECM